MNSYNDISTMRVWMPARFPDSDDEGSCILSNRPLNELSGHTDFRERFERGLPNAKSIHRAKSTKQNPPSKIHRDLSPTSERDEWNTPIPRAGRIKLAKA